MKVLKWLFGSVFLNIAVRITSRYLGDFLFGEWFLVYWLAYYAELYRFLVISGLLVFGITLYGFYRERLKEFKKTLKIYKPISRLSPSDFGIYTYNNFYIPRVSDQEIEKSLKENNFAFITGMPNIGKTRGAYELVKKLEGWYILKPPPEKIDISSLDFPPLLSRKRILLFLDDLDKYVGKSNLDELVYALRKRCKELSLIATCRGGEEFNQVFGQKEMATLLSLCQRHKIEPRKLKKEEEKDLAEGIGKRLEDVTSDGTPGSIVLGLDQMKKRYMELENDLKKILCILRLLQEASIFNWTEELVKNIAKSKMFELKIELYQWKNFLRVLQENGFTEKSDNQIIISHDSYLDNSFITECVISEELLIELKEELFSLKDAENLFYLGISFYKRKNLEESIHCFQESVHLNPDSSETHSNLGAALAGLKRYSEAEKEYKEALRINPDSSGTHSNLGAALAGLKRYSEAEKEHREAIRINPDYAGAHNNLGSLLKDLKRYSEAEKEYRESIRINPDYAEAHNNLGIVLADLKRYSEAEKEYREALRINPDYAEAHLSLGNVLVALNRYSEAEKEYREAIRINPDYAEAHNNLGHVRRELKRYPEAEKEYREALRINPDLAEAYANLGFLYIKMEKKEKAKKEFLTALGLFEGQGRDEDAKRVEELLKELEKK